MDLHEKSIRNLLKINLCLWKALFSNNILLFFNRLPIPKGRTEKKYLGYSCVTRKLETKLFLFTKYVREKIS